MRHLRMRLAAAVCCIVGFFVVMGIAGDYDYTEQVILRMSYDDYDMVRDTLTRQNDGRSPSEREIAHWWAEHHDR